MLSIQKRDNKSARGRHVMLCASAAKILIGDSSPIKYPANMDAARERCLSAAAGHQ